MGVTKRWWNIAERWFNRPCTTPCPGSLLTFFYNDDEPAEHCLILYYFEDQGPITFDWGNGITDIVEGILDKGLYVYQICREIQADKVTVSTSETLVSLYENSDDGQSLFDIQNIPCPVDGHVTFLGCDLCGFTAETISQILINAAACDTITFWGVIQFQDNTPSITYDDLTTEGKAAYDALEASGVTVLLDPA